MIGPYPYESGKVIGGVESVVSTLANSLAHSPDLAHLTVFDFFRGSQPARFEEISDKLDVFHYPAQKKLTLPTRSWLDYLIIKKFSQRHRPDIIHGQGFAAGDLAIRLTANPVVSIHGLIHVEARMALSASWLDRWRIRLTDGMVGRVLDRARVVISTSSYDFNALKDRIAGRHVLITNPVDAPFFQTQPTASENKTVIFAGVLSPRKNMTGLLRAFEKVRRSIPSARLAIAGPSPDADYYQEVQALTRRLNLQDAVEFRGFLENQELIASLARSRCLVLFSHEETSPTIIAQAMALGKPIVAARVGGIAELVTEGRGGFLVHAGDEDDLAQKLVRVLDSDDLARDMGGYNRGWRSGPSNHSSISHG